MNLTPDRQGYLGDLMNKSIPQLKELLERQEKILLKRKFLESLPDKGEKTRAFAAYLKHLIDQKSGDSLSPATLSDFKIQDADSWQKSKIDLKATGIPNIIADKVIAKENDVNVKGQAELTDSQVIMKDSGDKVNEESSTSLISGLEEMSIGDSHSSKEDTGNFVNSYERVIRKAEVNILKQKSKFLPNRTLLDDHIPPSPYPQDTRLKKGDKKEEESAVKPPSYRFQSSKLITIEESVQLTEKQRTLNEELLAQRAAKKLADQLLPKMDVYSPASADMRYREAADEHDQDSDDDDDDDNEASQDDEY